MCHYFLSSASIYSQLFELDRLCAAEVRQRGCSHCGVVLDCARYPRKPRGVDRRILGPDYEHRLSFCCRECRRRNTPPSVRFMGRKVYLGLIITLITALDHGLTPTRRQRLIDELDLSAQTLHRWRLWWHKQVPATGHWRELAGLFSPPIDTTGLPATLLDRVLGHDLPTRIVQLLMLVKPLTTTPQVRVM